MLDFWDRKRARSLLACYTEYMHEEDHPFSVLGSAYEERRFEFDGSPRCPLDKCSKTFNALSCEYSRAQHPAECLDNGIDPLSIHSALGR